MVDETAAEVAAERQDEQARPSSSRSTVTLTDVMARLALVLHRLDRVDKVDSCLARMEEDHARIVD